MSDQAAYSAILTLSPPSDTPVAVHVTLWPTDSIEVDGTAKPLGDCTLQELQCYAEELEEAVAETYQNITIRDLLVQPEFGVAVDATAEDWLDHVVQLVAAGDAEGVTDPIAEAVAASEVSATSADVPDSVRDAPEPDYELVPVEELPIPEIQIAEPEPVFEERVADEPVQANIDPSPEIRTAGILDGSNYPARNAVAIWFDEAPLRLMQGHARSSLRREVAGVMIGPRPEKQPDGRYMVHVTDMIIAKHTKMSGASVTYTPESWRYMNDQLREMYPDGDHVIVGWYHTHPGFGIFLSNMDLFIHTNFFTQKWHIAYVLDPVGLRSGFFSWDKRHSEVIPYGFSWPEWMNGSW